MNPLGTVFGKNVFNDAVMKERLPKSIYKSLRKTIEEGKPLDIDTANVIAHEMKEWAVEKGATHYTHWFQPLTGITAEKHDAFLDPQEDGTSILSFSGKELIQGEPDASSFPSGGLRATFEARGYTAWDCTSPAFVKDGSLCIPTAFCSYNGEALDTKTPLLRSMEVISKEAMRVLKALGNTTANKVVSNVGPEQEYFIVDKNIYDKRKDLVLTGRTLFGAMAPKGQELDDHYFGAIKDRISDYMKDLDNELWKLGISSKTKHNEVAPAQHELAPIYTTTNIATDHNQLIMETMKKVALKHGLVCLLHEKPFQGINGSGKHNNWSLSTDDGENLLNPGKTPQNNKQFLLFLSAVIAAVDEYADLLRYSASNPGNDHRLGANEAPPAIISIFLGDQLSEVVRQIVSDVEGEYLSSGKLTIGVSTLPDLPKDATDRNRTSPFAFTGNKFEFRMPPSSGSISTPNIILNTTVAEILSGYADRLENSSDLDKEVDDIIKENLSAHTRVLFDGNGYSDEWVAEAERRGLPNIKSTVESIKALINPKNIKVMSKHGVLTEVEMHSRYEIKLENYIKTINIEALTSLDMVNRDILPSVMEYLKTLADSVNSIKCACSDADVSVQSGLIKEISSLISSANKKSMALKESLSKSSAMADSYDEAYSYRYDVFEKMNELRSDIDKLETLVDSKYWPMPTYTDLLFSI